MQLVFFPIELFDLSRVRAWYQHQTLLLFLILLFLILLFSLFEFHQSRAVMDIDKLLFAGTRPLPYAACLLILALVGLGIHLARKKTASSPKDASGTVEKNPWVLQFPPSRRHTLVDLKLKGVTGTITTPAPHILRRNALPLMRTVDLDQDDLYTPTGFSTQDLRALGRFPDYSILTGVRHPEPYGPQFDIKKAVFRPFRPFRWSYHQTMGK